MQSIIGRALGRLYDSPYLLLVLVASFWAGNIVIGRYAVGTVPPVALAVYRWTGATLLALIFAWPHLRTDWPVVRRHIPLLTLLSLLSISAYNTLTYYALQFTEVINAVILQSTGPLIVAACTFLLFGERLGLWQLVGMVLSFVGILAIVGRGEVEAIFGLEFNIGDLILIFAVACYSLYSALLKLRPPMHPMTFVTVTMGWGAVLLLPFYGLELAAGHHIEWGLQALLVILYVAIFPSLLAHFFFIRGVQLVGANRSSAVLYLIPVLATAMAIAFLGERLHAFHLIGFVLVIGGVILATRERAAKTPSVDRP